MKYIITESRLENVIFKYLDEKLNGIKLKKGKSVYIVFAFPDKEYGVIGWDSPSQLITSFGLVNEMELMFSMDKSDVLDAIGRYVENKYNLEVSSNLKNSHVLLAVSKADR